MILFIEGPTEEADSVFLKVKKEFFKDTDILFYDFSEETGNPYIDIAHSLTVAGFLHTHYSMDYKPLFVIRGGMLTIHKHISKDTPHRIYFDSLLQSKELLCNITTAVITADLDNDSLRPDYEETLRKYTDGISDNILSLHDSARCNKYIMVKNTKRDCEDHIYPILRKFLKDK